MKTNYNQYLSEVLKSYNLNRISDKIKIYNDARQRIINVLPIEWKVYSPINAGSIKKRTAINTHFDYDIIIPLEHDKFEKIEDMLRELNSFFQTKMNRKEIQGLQGVRFQNVSVGLNFGIIDEGYDFDIVPGFELSPGDYARTGNLYLHPHRDENPERIKTNVKKQLEYFHSNKTPTQALHIIQLLKIWKYSDRNNKFKSFLLELMTIRCFRLIAENAKQKIPNSLWEQLKYVLEFIEKNIEKTPIKDPGNKANNVADSMTKKEKADFARKIRKLIHKLDLEENKGEMRTMKKNFPISII